MNGGRPLRFLAVTLGGWTIVRAALLWPTIDSVPTLIDAMIPPAAAEAFFAKAPPRRPVVRGGATVSRSIVPEPTEPLR